MKMLVLQPYLNLMGGVDRVILEIARHYDAKIYTLEYDRKGAFPEYAGMDIEVVKPRTALARLLPYRASQGLTYGYGFYRMRIAEDYDVLNPHISPSEWIRHRNERVLWYCHTPPREVYDLYQARMQGRSARDKLVYAAMAKSYKFIAGRVVRRIEAIATNSNTTNARIVRYFNRSASVINPGIDAKGYQDNGDERFFLCPSRITPNKRQGYAIDAFKRFARRGAAGRSRQRYRLVIAGAVSKDPEHAAYLRKLRDEARGARVEILENVKEGELRSLYSRCSAVLFAAVNEDYGFIPLEAMASGKPVVSVNEGGPTETIEDGKTGFLVNSAQEMAKRMGYLAEHPSLAGRMGRDGRRRVESAYTWRAFFEKFDPLARKVSRQKSE